MLLNNQDPISPSEAMEEMNSKQLTPNRVGLSIDINQHRFFQRTVVNNILPIITCVALGKAGLVVDPLRPSACLFVRPSVRNTFGVHSLCNL